MKWTTAPIAFLKKIVFLFLIIDSTGAAAQLVPLSPKATVSVLTCATANETYALFGHTALRISDPEQLFDVVFNYGAFDFSTPNFVAKFAKGDLQYFVVAHSYSDFIQQYQSEGRSVYEQKLLLTPIVKQRLLDRLKTTLQTEERFYTYKFIDRNCTTMVVDLLNQTLGDKVIIKSKHTDSSYRSVLFPYFSNHFYEQLGTSIIFGTKVDQKATTVFLPFELLESLKTSRFQNQALALPMQTLLSLAPTQPHSWWNNPYTYGALLLLLVFCKNRKVIVCFLTFQGILGIFFLFMSVYSLHPELAYNYNVLLFNPALLLLVYFFIQKNQKATRFIAYVLWAGFACYTIVLFNKAPFFLLLPLISVSALLVFRIQKERF
ncbi:MAG: DUF4105 domain-containing protein [Flavobacterium sp.]